jgi:hypothetical protein
MSYFKSGKGKGGCEEDLAKRNGSYKSIIKGKERRKP